MEENKIQHSKPVPPFVRFCAANIPMVFDDSLSYYEALCALWKWLQTDVIDVINNNARVTEVWREELTTFENNVTDEIEGFETVMRKDFADLVDLFNQLQAWVDNYFDNLDVQEEINNKLDDMVEDGTLQEIITTYIQSNVTWTFDSVSDMQAATNLIDGSYAHTMGYYSVNDGGEAFYKIVDNDSLTPDGGSIIGLSGDLKALLVCTDNTVNVHQFGAYGDETHDDTTAFQNALDYAATIKGTVRLEDKTYLIGNIEVHSFTNLVGEGQRNSTLKAKSEISGALITIDDWNENYITLSGFMIDGNKENNTLSYGIYIDKGASHEDSADAHCTFTDLSIFNVKGHGIYNGQGARENRFDHIVCAYNDGDGIYSLSSDCFFQEITCKYNKFNGIFVTSGACHFTDIKCFLNGYQNDSNNRYDLAGFRVIGTHNIFVSCDAQENYGDGFFISNGANTFCGCIADANGFKSQRYNPDGTYADMTDGELVYDGFHFNEGAAINNVYLECLTTDHRRNANHQLQRYGVFMGSVQKSSIIVTDNGDVAPIYYSSGWSVNYNYYSENYVRVNGVIKGSTISNRLTLRNESNDLRNAIDLFTGTDNTAKARITSSGTKAVQINNMNENTYVDTPVSLTLSTNGSGAIAIGDSNRHYDINIRPNGLGFFGKSPVAQQPTTANATDLASCITLCNALKTKLQNYGLIAADS